jgi:VWFA-related protein
MKKAAVTLLAAAIAIPLGARQQPSQPPPAFRAATDIVEVDVVVQDGKGAFVTDLKPADFEVREEGTPQKIDQFYLVNGNTTTGVGPPSGVGTEGARPDGPPPTTRAPRVFVTFFDNEHLTTGGFKRVQTAATKLFASQFKDGDVGGVVHGGRMANNRLTTSREELLKAVRDARPDSKSASRIFEQRTWPSMSDVEAFRIAVQNDEAVRGEVVRRACTDDPTLCPFVELAVSGKATQLPTKSARPRRRLAVAADLLNGRREWKAERCSCCRRASSPTNRGRW